MTNENTRKLTPVICTTSKNTRPPPGQDSTQTNIITFFDDGRKELYKDLESILPGYEVPITDANRDEKKYIARTFCFFKQRSISQQ